MVQLYRQIDGVSMGSALGPTLADIIMTEFEELIIKPLINSGTIKLYKRYVDYTLIITNLLLTNLITMTSIFLTSKFIPLVKPTCTGQYQHISSLSPWSRKVAWIRALVHLAYTICHTDDFLKDELQHSSWNGFP